ncbi:DUF5777 family beta-barrel protein [Pricia sp. S334]|uniref:DUF5777 family beta-barrel protein n=1 Tax=Pricia mediterranea TaxID=3076079 RepID=A0ABU3L4G3_9FLAO|nr:DUF5777 family beta-barrel protein [Pricia sp. S334]MDT7828636.1 DUF5777 family beta-barrel protein [Pricia sp. S334]
MNKIIGILLLWPLLTWSQDDLLAEIDTDAVSESYEIAAFKGLKLINIETTKMVPQKQFFFVVSHRFGSVKTGIEDFFGLDQAVTRLNFIYGISDRINIGVSRSSFQKTYEASLKLRLVRQATTGSPVTLVWFNSVQFNGLLDDEELPGLEFKHRLGYASQLLVSRKISRNISLELAPTYFHDNLVPLAGQDNSQLALGLGGRFKFSKRCAINLDYGLHLNRAENSPFVNPFSVGLDIETGGHVFQLHFTNAQPMNINNFLGEATGDWGSGDIYFGFNIIRVF